MDGGVKTKRFRPAALVLALAVLALAVLALAQPIPAEGKWPFQKGPYRKGQVVTVHGRATDAVGHSLGEVTVLLEISRSAFRWSQMRRETGNDLTVPVRADADGRYRIDWRWDPFYNRFALAVALPVREDGREAFEVFYRLEITQWLLNANPVEIGLVLPDTAALDELRAFLGSLDSEDEKRVYREMGRPDRVDEGVAHYDPDRSWWYFKAGKVYRFREGKVDAVVAFDPVPSEGVE